MSDYDRFTSESEHQPSAHCTHMRLTVRGLSNMTHICALQ
jgi:hypothetical protein